MSLLSQAREAFWSLLGPWLFMGQAAAWLPGTIGRLLRERRFDVLLSPARLRDAWFGAFWQRVGPNVKLNAERRVLPLLEGRTTGGRVLAAAAGPGLEGTVLELGAGSGFWVDVFAAPALQGQDGAPAAGRGARPAITRVLGVEPNPDQHPCPRGRVQAAGLEGVYDIVPVGVEDLDNPAKWGGCVEKESVDCIVSILCLCSVPEPERQFRALYGYLKKGGRWYVYEHVRTNAGWAMRAYQSFVNLFWPHFLGGCQLCRPTEKWLREAGPWTKVDVAQPVDEWWYQCVPHILGVFTK